MIYILLFSLFISGLGAWLAMKFGQRVGTCDIPNERSSHSKVIPKCGGVGILGAFIIACFYLSIPLGLWLTSVTISLISLWGGDKHHISPKGRLLIQFGCCLFFLMSIGQIKELGILHALLLIPFSIFIVGTANFYNFMDGIDGIAGITGFVCFSLLAFYSHISELRNDCSVLCMVLAFSCVGFLFFNIPKAKVFMGDVGSVFLGFLFACLVIFLSESVMDFFVMAGFLAPFYFDELFTMAIRIKDGDSLLIAHRKHTYQLLANELEISHLKISLSYGLAQLIIGLSAISLKSTGIYSILAIYFVYFICFILITLQIRKKARLNEN